MAIDTDTSTRSPPRRWLPFVLAIAFSALVVVFFLRLGGDPSRVPSALIGKPVPQFDLPALENSGVPGIKTGDLKAGRVSIVNVWASWCGPCRNEHPLLMELGRRSDVRLLGVNYKDDPANARRFLMTLGRPFAAIGVDGNGRAAIDWGVYGVPETFVIDGRGIIRYKWIGPLTDEALRNEVAQAIEAAQRPVN